MSPNPSRNRVGVPLPRIYEAELVRALRPMIRQVRATLSSIKSAKDARALGTALRREWPERAIYDLLVAIGLRAEARSSRGWAKLTRPRRDAAGTRVVDGRALVLRWARNAAKLITSVRDEVAQGLAADVVAALESGTDPTELAERWRQQGIPLKFGTLEGRVKVIAQHQLGMLHAEVQRERAGRGRYRVRLAHPGR